MRPIFRITYKFYIYMVKKQCVKNKGQIGDFILRNNQCSSAHNNVCAKGILVDAKHYLDLDSMLMTPVSKREAVFYGKRLKFELPTGKQMQMLEQNLEKINNSLLRIGRGDCMLLGSVRKAFWTRCEQAAMKRQERKSVLFLVPI